MVLFIFTLVLMFSLSAILDLMVRALPRVAEVDGVIDGSGGGSGSAAGLSGRRGLLDRWAHSELPEKIDASFNTWLLKFLRKFKVFTLKLDNSISTHLHKINRQKTASEKKATIDFKEISGKNSVNDAGSSDAAAED